MKKILFILPSLTVGGLEKVQVTLANKLVQNDYDVTIMTLSPEDDLKDELDERVHVKYRPPKSHLGNSLPYIRRKLYDDGMWERRASAKQLYTYYVGDEAFDVEIAFFRGTPVKIVSGSTNTRAVHLAWVHTDYKQAFGFKNSFKSMRQVYDAYQNMNRVVCVSVQAQKSFKEVIGDTGNVTTIYNMLPVKAIRLKSEEAPSVKVKKARFHIVLVGRLADTAKGQKRLLFVVNRLKNEGKEISLCFVGGGQDERELREIVRKNKMESIVTITGSQLNPYPYIKEADLLVCASFFEGYNLTVAEALILGVPVLSTDCTGPGEILDHGKYGMIVENSEEGLYNGLRQLMDNPEQLREYQEKVFQRQDFFDEDSILKQVTDLF